MDHPEGAGETGDVRLSFVPELRHKSHRRLDRAQNCDYMQDKAFYLGNVGFRRSGWPGYRNLLVEMH